MKQKHRGYALWETVLTFIIIYGLMFAVLFSYKKILFTFALNNEIYVTKRYIELARDYALTKKVRTIILIKDHSVSITLEDGEVIRKHMVPHKVSISPVAIGFTENAMPVQVKTIIFSIGKKQKKIIIDPSTGRVRVP
jgi:hypothetical protein